MICRPAPALLLGRGHIFSRRGRHPWPPLAPALVGEHFVCRIVRHIGCLRPTICGLFLSSYVSAKSLSMGWYTGRKHWPISLQTNLLFFRPCREPLRPGCVNELGMVRREKPGRLPRNTFLCSPLFLELGLRAEICSCVRQTIAVRRLACGGALNIPEILTRS